MPWADHVLVGVLRGWILMDTHQGGSLYLPIMCTLTVTLMERVMGALLLGKKGQPRLAFVLLVVPLYTGCTICSP